MSEVNNVRILAKGKLMSNDTRATGINNNDLIVGPSGAGKTRGYVKPNIMQCCGSMIIADTKGDLHGELSPLLKHRGYNVQLVDFTDTIHSDGYNPLDYIRYDADSNKYSEQDILTLCAALVPVESKNDPYWEHSARNLMAALVGYVLECLPQNEHTLDSVVKLVTTMTTVGKVRGQQPVYAPLLDELAIENPASFAVRQYQMYKVIQGADRTESCIMSFLTEKLAPLSYDGPVQMYRNPQRVDFAGMGREKTAVFLHISDTDRSMDGLVSLFYTQGLHALCESADTDYRDHRLPVPVRFFLDDFATNAVIPDFDNIMSVIRSREISASIILQSLSQLEAIYGRERSVTIVNNCDTCLYLGGQDVETAKYMAFKANKVADSILNMKLDQAYLFIRGQKPCAVSKYDLTAHEAYGELASQREYTEEEVLWENNENEDSEEEYNF